jgi:uncharacterized phage protein gp47/JayE
MPWPIPTPEQLFNRLAGGLEAGVPGLNARSGNSLAGILAGVQALGAQDTWLYLASLAEEQFADTAADVARHGGIWGVSRLLATAPTGQVALNGLAGVVLPAGIGLAAAGGAVYVTQAAITLAGGGADLVTVTALATGTAGNLAAGATLVPSAPIAGLTSATVAAGGLVGTDDEALEAWRARILARIRLGADYGQAGSYARAALGVAGVAYAAEKPGWLGAGTVGVVVAMAGPAVPNSTQLAIVQAALDAMRPVCASVTAVAASLLPVAVTVHLVPDTAATRAAVQSALALFFQTEAAIGGTLYASRLDEAISSASGEYAHTRSLPAGDVTLSAAQLATLGTVSFI